MLKELRIAAIDGNSFAGKTSLVAALSDSGYPIIWEPGNYTASFPDFPPKTYTDAKKAIDFFLEIEARRSDEIVALAEKSKTAAIMDRSLWCYITFQYVVRERMPQIPNAYAYSLDIFQKAIGDEKVIVPSVEIITSPKNQADHEKRVAQRGRVGINFLNDWETTEVMNKWLRKLARVSYGPQKSLCVTGSNGINDSVSHVESFLKNTNYFVDANIVFTTLRNILDV